MPQTDSEAGAKGLALTSAQQLLLVLLRVAVGWHFLYEGYLKISAESWSSVGYLANARGPFAALFQSIAQSPGWLSFADRLTLWGLTLVGVCLTVGLFSRAAAAGAVFFLTLFYLSNPPWPGVSALPGEGSYLIINKNLIELCVGLVLMAFPTGKMAGLDLILHNWLNPAPDDAGSAPEASTA